MEIGSLIERLALQVLYPLSEPAAEQAAERAGEIARVAGDLSGCPDRSGERGRHHQRIRPPADGERAARDGPIDLAVGEQLRHPVAALAREIARARCCRRATGR